MCAALQEALKAEAARRIDERIASLPDWRGALLARLRALVHEAAPDVLEEWKWRGVPVWSRDGMLCTGETYQAVVKMTFAHGASLPDPGGLFNSSLDGNVRRAIDFREGDAVDETALKALVRAVVERNAATGRRRPARGAGAGRGLARSGARSGQAAGRAPSLPDGSESKNL